MEAITPNSILGLSVNVRFWAEGARTVVECSEEGNCEGDWSQTDMEMMILRNIVTS